MIKITGSKTLLGSLIKKMSDTVNIESEERINKLVEELVLATPIDTGYARSRWSLNTLNSPGLAYNVKYSPLLFNLFGKKYTVSNDAGYIVYLNAGHSRQAAPYFIENTILQNGFTIE
jgi:hypothetical protein